MQTNHLWVSSIHPFKTHKTEGIHNIVYAIWSCWGNCRFALRAPRKRTKKQPKNSNKTAKKTSACILPVLQHFKNPKRFVTFLVKLFAKSQKIKKSKSFRLFDFFDFLNFRFLFDFSSKNLLNCKLFGLSSFRLFDFSRSKIVVCMVWPLPARRAHSGIFGSVNPQSISGGNLMTGSPGIQHLLTPGMWLNLCSVFLPHKAWAKGLGSAKDLNCAAQRNPSLCHFSSLFHLFLEELSLQKLPSLTPVITAPLCGIQTHSMIRRHPVSPYVAAARNSFQTMHMFGLPKNRETLMDNDNSDGQWDFPSPSYQRSRSSRSHNSVAWWRHGGPQNHQNIVVFHWETTGLGHPILGTSKYRSRKSLDLPDFLKFPYPQIFDSKATSWRNFGL